MKEMKKGKGKRSKYHEGGGSNDCLKNCTWASKFSWMLGGKCAAIYRPSMLVWPQRQQKISQGKDNNFFY